jgi:type II secretory pathway pseudopilin PulG
MKTQPKNQRRPLKAAFTLIETLVAITILVLAIVAPMSLTVRSLSSAYYARDQITASNLGQEGIEAVRSLRDHNVLLISKTNNSGVNIFDGIPINQWFTIDTRNNAVIQNNCGNANACPVLQTDCGAKCPAQNEGVFYGYPQVALGDNAGNWANTIFKRALFACYIQSSGSCSSAVSDEIKLTVIVSWKSTSFQARSITLYENLYRWIPDGSAGP